MATMPTAVADADGDNKACITKKEFRLVKLADWPDASAPPAPGTGTTYKQAKAIIDSDGRTSDYPLFWYITRAFQWKHCGNGGQAWIMFAAQNGTDTNTNHYQAVSKEWKH